MSYFVLVHVYVLYVDSFFFLFKEITHIQNKVFSGMVLLKILQGPLA